MNLDYVIIVIYILFITSFGLFYSGKSNIKDYFLGNKSVPWMLVCFSIVATETSTLTFLSIPGVAYFKDLTFIQIPLGFIIGRLLVSIVLLPGYFNGNYETAYEILEKNFGKATKIFMAVIFHITRLLADSIRLFSTSIPLSKLLGIGYFESISIIVLITLIYTIYGGIKSVITVDTIQLFLYLLCAIIGIGIVFYKFDFSMDALTAMIPGEKLRIFNWINTDNLKGILKDYNILSGIIGGALFSFASHGTDYLIVQRVLSCKDLKSGQKAIIASGFVVMIQFAIFLILGVFLYALYNGKPFDSADDIMPYFIINSLPIGIKGLMLAGIFAAAMSTLSSSINSLSASTLFDIINVDALKLDEKFKMVLARGVSVLWTLVLFLISIGFIYVDRKSPLVELGLGIASITYGPMLGIFILSKLKIKINAAFIIFSVIFALTFIIVFKNQYNIFWPWYVFIGVFCTISSALFFYKIKKN